MEVAPLFNSETISPPVGVELWKALAAEFVGTFALVLIGGSAAAVSLQQGGGILTTAIAFGLVLMTFIYFMGSYSGAHFNPAVSFGFAVTGRMSFINMILYWVVQLIAGIVAAALILYFFGYESGVGASIGSLTYTQPWKAVLVEAVLTFFLVLTVLLITRNPFMSLAAGLAIGLVLTFDIIAGGSLTGGSVNPARSLGPAIFSGNIQSYWIYVIGPLFGAFIAALIYKIFIANWNCKTLRDECGNPITDECGNKLVSCEVPVRDKCGNIVKDQCGTKEYDTIIKKT